MSHETQEVRNYQWLAGVIADTLKQRFEVAFVCKTQCGCFNMLDFHLATVTENSSMVLIVRLFERMLNWFRT